MAEWNRNLVTAICVQGDDGLILSLTVRTAISFSSYFVLGFPGNGFLQSIFLGVFLQETYDECTCIDINLYHLC